MQIRPTFNLLTTRIRTFIDQRSVFACLIAGALLSFALPPFGIFPLIFIALPVLHRSLQGATVRDAFKRGFTFAFGMLVCSLYWIAESMLVDLKSFWWAIPLAVLGLPFYLSLYTGLAAALYAIFDRRYRLTPSAGIFLLAILLSLAELARGTLLTGFPWNLIAQIWQHAPTLLQSVSLIGAYGLGLLTWLLALTPILLWHTNRARLTAALIVLAILSLDLWGAMRLAGAGDITDERTVENVRLRLVQPNIAQDLKIDPAAREANFQTTLDLAGLPTAIPRLMAQKLHTDVSSSSAPTHVIWPEAAVPFLLDRDEDARLAIAASTPADGVTILGAITRRFTEDGTHEYGNSLVTIDTIGALRQRYDKAHLVPFGEYFPFRTLLSSFGININAIAAGSNDFSAGPGPQSIGLPGLPPVSPLVCYEVIFPGHVAPRKHDGILTRPGWLLNITNDAWFGSSIGPYQHFEIARLRAIEEGLPLVRVANTGISGVIDPYGRVIAQTQLNTRTVLDIALPVSLTPTLFSRVIQLPYLFLLISFGLLAFGLQRPRKTT